jgi:hypothetical protein
MRRKKYKYLNVSKNKIEKTYKGVLYKSRLEAQMAKILDDYKLPVNYEAKTFEIFKSEKNHITSYRKTTKNKGEFKPRDLSINSLKYTPDFIDNNLLKENAFIIEVKGRPDTAFMLRYKMFLRYCNKYYKNVVLYMPRNKTQCLQTARLIVESQKKKKR